MTMYAIITWNTAGPIKTWSQMQSVELHNGRGTALGHTVDGAPAPEYLYGTPNIVADARQRLTDHDVDPDRRHCEGVIAREVVLTASREFFAMGTAQERAERLASWKAAQVPFLIERFGKHRLVSAVLHQDETTPHVHAVVLALKHAADGRSPGAGPRWTLAGDVLSARGQWAKDQTAYAFAMAPFGLRRGREQSGNKYRPHAEHMADLEAQAAELEMQRRDLEAKRAEAAARQKANDEALVTLRDSWIILHDNSQKIAQDRQAVDAACAEADALTKLAEEKDAKARAKGQYLQHQFLLLKEQQDQVAAREAAVEAKERMLEKRGSAGGAHLQAALAAASMQR